jgi:hypothetical protein
LLSKQAALNSNPPKKEKKNTAKKLGMVGHAYNPRTQEAERGES